MMTGVHNFVSLLPPIHAVPDLPSREEPMSLARTFAMSAVFAVLLGGCGGCSESVAPADDSGAPCTEDSECSSGYCTDGFCQSTEPPDASEPPPPPSCIQLGESCTAGGSLSCCTGVCADNGSGTTVCRGVAVCLAEEAACTSPGDCCSLHCVNGKCFGGACVQIDGDCSEPSECCSGICTSGKCTPIPNATCKSQGEACTQGLDCCSKNCRDNVCRVASFCSAGGDICYEALDCCNGVCEGATGGAPGTCAATVSVPGATGCTMGGEPCTDSGTCCSHLCTDLGTGVASCVLGSGCRERGEICSKREDCCGWQTSGVLCVLATTDPPVGRCSNPQGCQPVGNCCGAFGDNCRQACCDGQKAVCQLDQSGLPRCMGGGGVCKNGYDGLDPLCCIPQGEQCSFRDQCCELNPCIQGPDGLYRCVAPTCLAAGSTCTPGGMGAQGCCNGLECLSAGEFGTVCRVRTPPLSGADAGTPDSDGGSADAGPSCLPNTQACSAGAECCSGTCIGGVCGTCKTDGNTCGGNSECCSGACFNGVCHAPYTCVAEGGTCSGTSECCYGTTCNVPAGQASGTCQPGATCGASGQRCSTTEACCSGLACRNQSNPSLTCTANDPACVCRATIN